MRGGTHIVEARLQRMLSKHSLLPALLLLLLAGGCAGPYVLRHSRPKYAEAVQVTRNEQLLLNLVRIRYRDTPSFLELSSLATQFSFDGGVGIAGTIKENSKNFNVLGLSAGIDASERPTASYLPLQGADFVTKLISPIEEETIVLLTRSGWKGERVFRIAVQSLNGLTNMRRASGPSPLKITQTEINEATEFRNLVQNLEEQSQRKELRFNYETVEVPKSTAIPISTLTPEHAVQAAQHGFKITHQHQRISIDIDKIKLVSREANSYIDEHLLDNLVKSVEKDGLPRPIRVKFDPDTEPLSESYPEPHKSQASELLPLPHTNNSRPLFAVVDDDIWLRAVKRIHEEKPNKFKYLSCDVIDPDNVVLAGTSQKLIMTWDADHNKAVKGLELPGLDNPSEGRYVLQIEPRSLMGAMFYLSHAICVPLEHQMAGLVVITTDEFGNPFEWVSISGDLLSVKSSKHKPACASVAVKYRGYWFYIDDRDHSSKATFGLLMQLFELRASGGTGQGPVLTLPVGI
jgi:hypothetical protein